jgi:hypothetical protein
MRYVRRRVGVRGFKSCTGWLASQGKDFQFGPADVRLEPGTSVSVHLISLDTKGTGTCTWGQGSALKYSILWKGPFAVGCLAGEAECLSRQRRNVQHPQSIQRLGVHKEGRQVQRVLHKSPLRQRFTSLTSNYNSAPYSSFCQV